MLASSQSSIAPDVDPSFQYGKLLPMPGLDEVLDDLRGVRDSRTFDFPTTRLYALRPATAVPYDLVHAASPDA